MIIHIVPTVPPDFNGLADYCLRLSQNWPDDSTSWGCLTLQIPSGAKEKWPQAKLVGFQPTRESLLSGLDHLCPDTVILHYVNYAYHPKGIPFWLPAALREWKKKHPAKRLVTMFHELWAGGGPWRSCFWVAPLAKSIVRDLARMSDCWVASCQRYFDLIVGVGGRADRGAIIPIATAIEATSPVDFQRAWPLFEGGKLKIAVFGLASTRNAALETHAPLIRELCQREWVERISVLGQKPQNQQEESRLEELIAQIGADFLWQRAYDLSSSQASELLRQQDLGFIKETPALFTKSSVFAAFCSHGIIVVCAPKKSARETPDSPLIVNNNPLGCLQELHDKETISTKKRNIEALATTSLNWSCVARNWMNHVNGPK